VSFRQRAKEFQFKEERKMNLCKIAEGASNRMLVTVARAALVLSAGILGLVAVPACADTFPQKPITIIVTFGAGSASDVNARFYARALKERLNATAVVDIRPGAAGMIGAQIVAKAAPDGYTVLMGSGTVNAANYPLYRDRITYTPQQFETVAVVYVSPAVLFSTKGLAGDTLQAVLEDAKRTGRKLSCGSGNAVTQIACEMLNQKTGADIVSAPYKGNAQSLTDLAGGQISIAFADVAAAMPFMSRGAVRPVAVPSKSRLGTLPEVKTFAEQGIADFDFLSWNALFVPAGTSKEIVAKLNEAARHMLASAEWERQRMATTGIKVSGDLKESHDFVAAEITKWERYVKESGVKAE
jgi:tripartite-type tricarboxylate transporter receptor subunit TctC